MHWSVNLSLARTQTEILFKNSFVFFLSEIMVGKI